MTLKRKSKEWFDKNERLNADYTIQVGDRLYVSKSNDLWVVAEIIEGFDIEDHGSILLIKQKDYSNYVPLGELDSNTYEHYVHFGWQRLFRIIHATHDEVIAGVISTAPYKNWQEWLDGKEGKKIRDI